MHGMDNFETRNQFDSIHKKDIFSSPMCPPGPTQPPMQWVRGHFTWQRSSWVWCWPLTPPSAEVRNKCSYNSTPPHVFI